jgi:serine kinase of HPr protein (carbohydrate metabolism regulator)
MMMMKVARGRGMVTDDEVEVEEEDDGGNSYNTAAEATSCATPRNGMGY